MKDDNDQGGTSLTAGAAVSVSAADRLSHDEPQYLTVKEGLAALKQFTKKCQRMSPNGRRAAINWLVDVYLREK
jgi:hypothetical protein